MKSIDFKPREKGGECELIFDVTMQKSILKRLKDDAFKEMVEFETEQGALDLMKKVIFCEAWGNPPFNNNQSYFWDGTRLYSGLLGGVGELSEAVGK